MKESEHITLIREQAFNLATSEAARREASRSGNIGKPLTMTRFDASKIPTPRERNGERVWAELASTLLDYDSWQSIAEYLNNNVAGLSGTSWLEGRFDGLELKSGTLITK